MGDFSFAISPFLILVYGGNWNVPTIEKVRDIEIDICDNDDTAPR
jgi:hypothetical protein